MEVYNPTTDEQFPRLPWYDLNYQKIIDMVNGMLDEFIFGLDKFASTDPRIKALLDEAEKAKSFPDLEKCRMAVLGEQGAGKSTILTALMGGRNLLDRSGDTKSCTAVPTIIEHKKGADDNIRENDVTIQWLSADEILAHVLEQIRRWTNVYPGTDPVVHEAEENEEDEVEGSSDEEDFPGIGNEDCEAEELPELTPKMRKDFERDDGASTAKEFFEVVFETEHDEDAKQQLEERLNTTDIRLGGFADLCVETVKARFAKLDLQFRIRGNISRFLGVPDRDLRGVRQYAKELSPFLKDVTIATGHVLLRYGMCFYDLPGESPFDSDCHQRY
jgi:hypothetical protein